MNVFFKIWIALNLIIWKMSLFEIQLKFNMNIFFILNSTRFKFANMVEFVNPKHILESKKII